MFIWLHFRLNVTFSLFAHIFKFCLCFFQMKLQAKQGDLDFLPYPLRFFNRDCLRNEGIFVKSDLIQSNSLLIMQTVKGDLSLTSPSYSSSNSSIHLAK